MISMLTVSPSDIVDRYTIVKLKSEKISKDAFLAEYEVLTKELDDLIKSNTIQKEWIDEMYNVNLKIWDLEAEIGSIANSKENYARIGELALQVRHWNTIRTEIKSKIVKTIKKGFLDRKEFYSK